MFLLRQKLTGNGLLNLGKLYQTQLKHQSIQYLQETAEWSKNC